MTNKKLVTLTAVAAVLAGLAYVSNSTKKVKAPALVGKPVLPAFEISDVSRIEAGVSGGKKLVLESTDAGWVIKSLFNYPADIAKIRENLLKLKDLKAGHVATGKKLDKPTLVDLQNAAGKSITTLLLGDKHLKQAAGEMAQFGGGSFPDGRYVSATGGGDAVVLVKETLEPFDGDPKSWTDTQVCSVPSADATAIELSAHGASTALTKKNGAWTIEGLGAKEEFDTTKSYGVESALNYLNFSAVADPALTEEQLGFATGAVYKVALKTGESYTAKIGNAAPGGSDRYFKVCAAFAPVGTNAAANAELAKKVEGFNAKTAKWAFVIPSYNAENMIKTRADFIKAKEEPKKDDAAKEEPKKP